MQDVVLQSNSGEKEDKLDFEPQNRGRLIDGKMQNTWLLLHPWPIGQDTLDIDFKERLKKRRKNSERLFANPASAIKGTRKILLLADSVHLVANPALPRTDLN